MVKPGISACRMRRDCRAGSGSSFMSLKVSSERYENTCACTSRRCGVSRTSMAVSCPWLERAVAGLATEHAQVERRHVGVGIRHQRHRRVVAIERAQHQPGGAEGAGGQHQRARLVHLRCAGVGVHRLDAHAARVLREATAPDSATGR